MNLLKRSRPRGDPSSDDRRLFAITSYAKPSITFFRARIRLSLHVSRNVFLSRKRGSKNLFWQRNDSSSNARANACCSSLLTLPRSMPKVVMHVVSMDSSIANSLSRVTFAECLSRLRENMLLMSLRWTTHISPSTANIPLPSISPKQCCHMSPFS
ncbi:hypothetical protein ACHAXT_003375 [Thalassiosira profunda]